MIEGVKLLVEDGICPVWQQLLSLEVRCPKAQVRMRGDKTTLGCNPNQCDKVELSGTFGVMHNVGMRKQ